MHRTLAEYLWGDRTLIGNSLLLEGEAFQLEVIGVVGNILGKDFDSQPRAQLCLPFQYPFRGETDLVRPVTLVGKCAYDWRTSEETVRAQVRAIGGEIVWCKNVQDFLEAELAPTKLRATVAGFYALFGVLLSFFGVLGLMHFVVSARTLEMGIRIAPGGGLSDILQRFA